jgi:hypothetical protein
VDSRRSVWPAVLTGLLGIAMIVGGMLLPWIEGRTGAELPWRSVLPYDLARPEVSSFLSSIALPIVVMAAFSLLAIIVRVRWLAIALAFVAFGLEIAWFASETFRRTRGDLLASQLEAGAWLALGGAILVIAAAFMTPRWEPQVR